MKSNRFSREVKLRYSHAWLWWKYVNYGGNELGGLFVSLFGLFLLGISFLLLLTVVSQLKIDMPFWLEGKRAKATINNKARHVFRGSKGRPQTYFSGTYDFRDAVGNLQQGHLTLGTLDHDSEVGDTLMIEYLASDPRQNRPVGNRVLYLLMTAFLLVGLIGGALAFSGARWLVSGIRTLVRRVHLIDTGQAAVGLIDRLEPVAPGSSFPECSYHYLVPVQAGKPSEVYEGTLSLNPRQAKQMRRGDLLLVVFDPEWPPDHTVDVFRARFEEPEALLRAINTNSCDGRDRGLRF